MLSAVELTKQFVKIDSTNPGAEERGMEQAILNIVKNWDFDFVKVKTEEAMPNRQNIMLEIEGNPENPEMVFFCHMDTVPIGRGWRRDPFGAEEIDGKIFGRGSCDMKSGFACALSAFYHAACEVQKTGTSPQRTIKLIATVDEEGEMHGSARAIKSGWVSKKSMLLDTEPTSVTIQNAHKGRTWFSIHVEGITAHASTPWKGADAIAAMAEVISRLRKSFLDLEEHPLLGKSTITFGRIEGGKEPYIVSDECTVSVDMRLTTPYTTEFAKELVQRAGNAAMECIPGAKVTYEVTGDRPFIDANATSFLLEQLKNAGKTVSEKEISVGIFNGYTDTAVVAGQLGNVDCMSFGPGNLEMAHKPDEYVFIHEIRQCEKILTELMNRLL